jgi:SSS family solute:Na+ symporter
MNLYLVLLVSYAAVLMGLGLWIGRRVRNTGDFFVAGRRLGPGLLFSTMLAANIGAGSTVSAAALGYADGLSAWWWIGSAGFGSIVLAWWVGPRIRRLAAEHDFRTVGDFLEQRYGPSVRATVALLLLVGALALLAAQFIGGAAILSVVAGIDRWVGCVIAGLVVTVYFTAGGLLTSAWINVVQLAVLLGGFVIVVPLALTGVGGWESVVAATSGLDGYWNPWQGGGSGWFYLAMLGPAFIVSPGLLQKVYGARDDRTVRIGVMANGVALLLFAAVPPLLGMMMRTLTSDLASPDLALPTLFVEALPPVVGAVGLAALFSAEISSADAILFMLSTSMSQDIYRRFVRPAATDAEVLRAARLAAITGGVLATALAVVAETIVAALGFFYTVISVSLFIPVIAGLYLRRLETPEALTAIAAGVSIGVVTQVSTGGIGVGGLTPAMLGLGAAARGCGAVVVIRRRQAVVGIGGSER